MSDEIITPESAQHITSADETDTFDSEGRMSVDDQFKKFDSEGRMSVDDQFKKFKNDFRNEKRKWNVFEETGTGDKSVSERRYDKSLQKKYKYLKVMSISFFDFYNPVLFYLFQSFSPWFLCSL